MAKPEWGEKRRCKSCGKAFYDMKKDPIVCPSCGTEHKPEKILKPSGPVKKEAPKKPVKPVEDEESSLLLDDDKILEEDDVDLPDDDDDDDLSGVVSSPKRDDEDL